MSGGSYDYAYCKIEDMAENIRDRNDPRRIAFKKLLTLVGRAAHDIEWVDSCDYGPGDEHAAIDKCLAFLNADADTIKKAAAYDELKSRLQEFFK